MEARCSCSEVMLDVTCVTDISCCPYLLYGQLRVSPLDWSLPAWKLVLKH